jgi:multiple sugar transport system permease protein
MTVVADRQVSTGTRPAGQPGQRRRRPGRAALYLCALVVGCVALFPLYWMVISSLKTPAELGTIPTTWWPHDLTLDAYRTVFEIVPFAQSFLNSVVITAVCSLSVLITSIMAGFVFAKYRFRGRDPLFWLLIGTMFLPPIVTIVPLYNMMSSLGLTDSYAGVVLPWLANAFGIFLMRQFIADVPDELLDAARLDGASEFRLLATIIVPLLRPAIITLLVFTVVYYWNNFLWPLTILQSQEKFPITITLAQLLSYNTSVQYQGVVMAGVLIASLPTLLVFLAAQRVFVQGISRSGIK